jgi:hypothetical protein
MPPELSAFEDEFLRSEQAIGNIPIWQMWGTILEHCPGARGRHLWDDELNDVFSHAYKHASGRELWATCELAGLRWRFFERLRWHRIGLSHVNDYEITSASVWYTKLLDRLRDTKSYRRSRRNTLIRPPETAQASRHEWMH